MKVSKQAYPFAFKQQVVKRLTAGECARRSRRRCGEVVAVLNPAPERTLLGYWNFFETRLKAESQHDHRPSATAPAARPPALPVYVAYDISDRRRRNCLRRLLLGFGEPVQESVFLCLHTRTSATTPLPFC